MVLRRSIESNIRFLERFLLIPPGKMGTLGGGEAEMNTPGEPVSVIACRDRGGVVVDNELRLTRRRIRSNDTYLGRNISWMEASCLLDVKAGGRTWVLG